MQYQVIITKKAIGDLRRALNYIAKYLYNKTAARNLNVNFYSFAEGLAYFPHRYPIVSEPLLHSLQVRYIPIDNYILFFIIDETKNQIQILRFLHSRSEWRKILGNASSETSDNPNNIYIHESISSLLK